MSGNPAEWTPVSIDLLVGIKDDREAHEAVAAGLNHEAVRAVLERAGVLEWSFTYDGHDDITGALAEWLYEDDNLTGEDHE